jgi:predicted PurR-regulated permease PerM
MEAGPGIRTEKVLLAGGLLLIGYLLGNVLLLVFAAIVLAVGFDGAAQATSRKLHITHGWALAGVGITVISLTFAAIGLSARRLFQQFRELAETVIDAANRLESWLSDIGAIELVHDIEDASDGLAGAAGNVVGQMMTVGMSLVGALSGVAFLIVMAFFLSGNPQLYRRALIRLVPPDHRAIIDETLSAIAYALRWWFLGQLASMTLLGTAVGLGLFVMGVELWFALAVLTAGLTFVPFIGPLIATVPIVAVSFTESTQTGLIVLSGYIIIQNIEGNIVTPMIQHKAVNLAPALLIGVQVLLGVIFGPLGLILGAPLTVVSMVVIQKLWVEYTLGEKVT